MKRRFAVGFVAAFLLFGMTGLAQAALTTIGTAQFGGTGEEYKLIWDDDNNGNSVVWLDYTNSNEFWSDQMSWAASLDGELTYNINSAYTVDWGANSWRLPNVRIPELNYGAVNSEIGHLYHTEFGTLPSHALDNTGEFDNFDRNSIYLYSTLYEENPERVWFFSMSNGSQNVVYQKYTDRYNAIAIRTGKVSAVPVPAAAWLLGSGLVGLVGARRKFNK